MDLQRSSGPLISESNNEPRASPVLPRSEVITPTRPKIKAPGSEYSGALLESGNFTGETPSGRYPASGVFQKSSHLPTPHSPGNIASYLLTRNPNSAQNSRSDSESTELPTRFQAYTSPSSPLFRPHSILTPESSPLLARSRSHGSRPWPQNAHPGRGDSDSAAADQVDGSQSRASTPPRTPSRQISIRPATPMVQSRPTTPSQERSIEQPLLVSATADNLRTNDLTTSLHNVKDEPWMETSRFSAQLIESHLASNHEAESRRPDYFKRLRRLAPSSSLGTDGTSLTSNLGGQDGSLLWSSANVGVINSPVKGKRIALFQETSEESFEESLMAGGYGRYRSDRPWKLDEAAEAPNQLGDAVREEELGSRLELTEDEKRKKTRLAAFLDPPQSTSSTQLFPVEIEGCGRVLMKVEPPEPRTPPKPTPKAKRSRKRKKSADMKPEVNTDNVAAPEDSAVDAPNWPDTEFPWRSRLVAQDGLSSSEREERLRHIESFLDRDSDEDDVEEGHSLSIRRGLDEMSSRSPRPGRGKTYPLLSHFRGCWHGTTTLSTIPSDPADARTALLCKKSMRAVHLRLLRRQGIDRGVDSEDGEVLCVCRGHDDGRPLVQCDGCRTWYHLECIGIQSTSELGREEDPWFCANCGEVKTPPLVGPLKEPTFVPTHENELGVGERGSADMEGYDPPFLNAGLRPSPTTPWTRSGRPPTTPPRSQYAPHTAGTPWDEPPSSSSRGEPRTPQFDSASAFGDMVRVYGMTPGRSLEASSSTVNDESPFDPTSTPSRGIRFGLPFTTPKEGRWPAVRGGELFHTPRQPGDDGGAASLRYGQPLVYHGRVGEVSEEPSGLSGLHRASGPNNVTPIERDLFGGPKRMQVLDSPLGAKRSKRNASS